MDKGKAIIMEKSASAASAALGRVWARIRARHPGVPEAIVIVGLAQEDRLPEYPVRKLVAGQLSVDS